LRAEAIMFEEYLGHWHELTPQAHTAIKTVGLALTALLAGHFIGSMVARTLRNKNFDLALRMPGAPPAEHGMTPTFFAGMLVRLTVWALAAGWFAHQYERPELAQTISVVVSRTWAVAGVLTVALTLGGVLARRLMDCFEGPKSSPDPLAQRNGYTAAPHGATPGGRNLAGMVGAGAYLFVGFVVLLMCADFFDWPLTRAAATALWQLAQNLLLAGSALGIGYLGARWARELATPDTANGQMRTGQYTAMGIVAATTVLAVGMMLASTGVMVGLVALMVLGVALWLPRREGNRGPATERSLVRRQSLADRRGRLSQLGGEPGRRDLSRAEPPGARGPFPGRARRRGCGRAQLIALHDAL
jgi:hypothetical protein